MPGGRPSTKYPRQEFIEMLTRRMALKGFTLVGLAKLTHIDRGTLSRVLTNEIPCPTDKREILCEYLGATEEERRMFLVSKNERDNKGLVVEDTDNVPLHNRLNRGQERLFRAQYEKAKEIFLEVGREAKSQNDLLTLADAHMRMAWVHFEEGSAEAFERQAEFCISTLEVHLHADRIKILDSLRPGSHSSICSRGDAASRILLGIMHLRSKFYTERVAYLRRSSERSSAEMAFDQSLVIANFLDDPLSLAHIYRWQAVLLSSEEWKCSIERADHLIDLSNHLFGSDGKTNGPAYLARDTGIVNLYADRPVRSRNHLITAIGRLADFNDPRGMGPVFRQLSHLQKRWKGDARLARCYALAGAAAQPYYFIAENARSFYADVDDKGWTRDLNALYKGDGCFSEVREVLGRVHKNEGKSPDAALEANLQRVFPKRKVVP